MDPERPLGVSSVFAALRRPHLCSAVLSGSCRLIPVEAAVGRGQEKELLVLAQLIM